MNFDTSGVLDVDRTEEDCSGLVMNDCAVMRCRLGVNHNITKLQETQRYSMLILNRVKTG